MTIYVASEGVTLSVYVTTNGKPLDMTGATVDLVLKNSSGKLTKPAITITDALTGKCTYSLTKTDLSVSGDYQVQPIVKYADGREFPGSVSKFPVSDRL